MWRQRVDCSAGGESFGMICALLFEQVMPVGQSLEGVVQERQQ